MTRQKIVPWLARSAGAGIILIAPFLVCDVAIAEDRSSFYTEPYEKKALEIYRTSIGFRTAETHGQVPAFGNYLAAQFRAGGFADDEVHILPSQSAAGEDLVSLVVIYRGDGSSGRKPILLLGHMDVVEALPEDWQRDPFRLTEENGYFFGRGAYGDKFGTTTLTTTFLRLKAEKFTPVRHLVIAFSGDEETAMLAMQNLAHGHRSLIDAEFALNAGVGFGILNDDNEAVAYELQPAEKTFATFELTIHNPGGHSSMPRADNAMYELASVLKNIEAYRFPDRSNEVTRRYFDLMADLNSGDLADAMRRFSRYPLDEEAVEILYRDPH